ncbi:LysR substrate-binding domain-containing protein [Terrarubrum flagellatum]|uniref:LysR substrate-binding domain-containing protein n=1 Tax=Terrirubrum flagellatum TaxID=2895980 RepID=UPI0031455FB6
MDVRWMQDFLAVAESGNFTAAAASRNVSQAAFSRRIQSLEHWVGATLIDRSVFPTRLTPEGERFREHAAEIVRQIVDARADLQGELTSRRDHIRVALPHALATGHFATWWSAWDAGKRLSCQAIPSNVHDAVTSFVAGAADLLICYHTASQPIDLNPDQYERAPLGAEALRPCAAMKLASRMRNIWPGSAEQALPLLMYSRGTYLGRMVDLLIDNANRPLRGQRMFESDMSDTLCRMAIAGHGVAWLPDCIAEPEIEAGRLGVVADDPWNLTLHIVAYRDRSRASPAVDRLWSRITRAPAASAETRKGKSG